MYFKLWNFGQKWPKTGETESLALRPFYKEFGRGTKFGPNGNETGVHKLFW